MSMKPAHRQTKLAIIATLTFVFCAMCAAAVAADVDVRLSAKEAWVGSPIVLQIALNNATDYELPTLPEIDGCEIRSAGAPSQSSQITIINGRQSQTRSVVLQYLITPRREGTFEIPSIGLVVDGKTITTDKQRFVATKSETGNLLFVEIEGAKKKVYVGQPLELTLRIWIRPFRDSARNITLSESNMWQMISEQTSWGSFLDRIRELAANNQHPRGEEVLRDNGQGSESSYYRYEITATVYPKRAGKIEADDVQIVVNYPTELGIARDPFADFFENSGFGRRSPFSQMMDDDFFSSAFGNRLTVSATRPIVGEAKVGATEVLPVPAEGRPADYRGAVGRYNIVTQATPTAVAAGDPITLNIGIAGTGPMELVQAPPLSELTELTADFKVADQSLPGFVQNTTKLFSTTIRPRHEGITQIPPIPFSFFDPDTEKYETAVSDPIRITVEKSDSLSLDAIVGTQRHANRESKAAAARDRLAPNFTNDNSAAALVSQSPSSASSNEWWWYFVIAPPIAWLTTVIVRHRTAIGNRLPSFQSAETRCVTAIGRADTSAGIVVALTNYIASRTRQPCATTDEAIGALRTSGLYSTAIDAEAFFQQCSTSSYDGSPKQAISEYQHAACEIVRAIQSSSLMNGKSQVRRYVRTAANRSEAGEKNSATIQRASLLLLAILHAISTCIASTDEAISVGAELSRYQKETLLKEAGDVYRRGTELAQTDPVEASDLFRMSVQKYQILVESGIRNAILYRNLGNACLQSQQLGRAIANYERSRLLAPNDSQLAANLEFADSLVEAGDMDSAAPTNLAGNATNLLESIIPALRHINELLIRFPGRRTIVWTLVISSLVFWGLLIVRTVGYQFPVWRFAIVPLLVLVMSLTSAGLASTQPETPENGIIVSSNTTLHSGDGEQFEAVLSLDSAQGHRVRILTSRGDWTQVTTRHGHTGWLPSKDVEAIIEPFVPQPAGTGTSLH